MDYEGKFKNDVIRYLMGEIRYADAKSLLHLLSFSENSFMWCYMTWFKQKATNNIKKEEIKRKIEEIEEKYLKKVAKSKKTML